MSRPYAFVTLLTSNAYLSGALTCCHSLQDAEGPTPANDFDTVCLVTPATVSVESMKQLRRLFTLVVGVESIQSTSARELALLGRPDLVATLTKLHAFRLTQYKKVIYLDADTLILRPLSHLFTTTPSGPHVLSAAPDIGWPDCFNSGVLVLSPDQQTFEDLRARAASKGSWDGGDQGLLNDHFENWNRLSFGYNVTPSNYYQYLPAMQRYGHSISVLHFIGASKPWDRLHRSRPSASLSGRSVPQEAANDYNGFLGKWFDVYERHYGQLSTAALATSSLQGHFNPTEGNFVVPTYTNAWDQPKQVAYRPPSPEDLKTMFEGKLAQGGYTTLPLSQPQITYQEPTPPLQQEEPRRVRFDESLPTQPARPSSPPKMEWDPAKSGPEGYTKHQMAQPMDQHYDNAWDRPSKESQSFFKAPKYNAVPSDIQSHYQNVMAARHKDVPKATFPWDEQQGPAATRRFPDSPARVPSPKEAPKARAPSPPVAQPVVGSSYTYANAWDSIKGIRKYADSITKPKQQQSWRSSATGRDPNDAALQEKYAPASGRRYSSTDRESRADDGDDEEDEDERPPIRYRQRQTSGGSSPTSATSQASAPAARRPIMKRAEGSVGSVSRMPSLAAAQNGPEQPETNDLRSGLAKSGAPLTAHVVPAPLASPSITTSRVFHPSTDTGIVRQEGLAALQRFIQSMEQKGAAASPAQPPPQNGR